eukprot:scaffold182561_cov36-Tisochrysis_lutea.AAC.2
MAYLATHDIIGLPIKSLDPLNRDKLPWLVDWLHAPHSWVSRIHSVRVHDVLGRPCRAVRHRWKPQGEDSPLRQLAVARLEPAYSCGDDDEITPGMQDCFQQGAGMHMIGTGGGLTAARVSSHLNRMGVSRLVEVVIAELLSIKVAQPVGRACRPVLKCRHSLGILR